MIRRVKMWFIGAMLVVVGIAAQGCSNESGVDVSNAPKQFQVEAAILSYFDDTLTVFPAGANFEDFSSDYRFSSVNCFPDTEKNPGRLKTFGRMSWIRGVESTDIASYLGVVKSHWQANGWILDVDTPEQVLVRKDDYSLSIRVRTGPALTLAANSPCAVPGS